MEKIYIPKHLFNPDKIIDSGQVFRMHYERISADLGWYYAYSGNHAVSFRHIRDDEWNFYTEDWEFWRDYFDLNTAPSTYSEYNEKIRKSNDQFLINALSANSGVRILKQDLWECLVSFIISQQNSIRKIIKTVNGLCERFGTPRVFISDSVGTYHLYYMFPTPEQIANLSLSELQGGTMLGYRAQYILKLSRDIENGKFSLDRLTELSYEEAISELKTIYGVGDKVANCVALYGLHLMESYPIDTWMEKIITQDYKQYKDTQKYMEYINSKYAGFQGYVQQLQFMYKRQIL